MTGKIAFQSAMLIATAGSIFVAAPARAQTLAADYQVQNVYTSSVGTIGPLTTVGGTGAGFVSDTVDGNTQEVLQLSAAGGLNAQTGVQVQTNPFISSTDYSIVLLASLNVSTELVATKVFDFKNLSSDDGLYVNDLTGALAFNGVTTAIGAGAIVPTGTYEQIVLTRDNSGLTTVYANGVEAFHFTDTANQAVLGDSPSAPNPQSFLTVFKDDSTGTGANLTDETTLGNIARLRLYDGALTATQVAALDRSAIPEPTSAAALVALCAAPLARRRRKM